mmetsp:Transcript_16812/g.42022  ORF Transcript_16812/g.42022 Transcript_16812/m.42022 type:complete len:80 (-) Transcript_16812:372-611(-)
MRGPVRDWESCEFYDCEKLRMCKMPFLMDFKKDIIYQSCFLSNRKKLRSQRVHKRIETVDEMASHHSLLRLVDCEVCKS